MYLPRIGVGGDPRTVKGEEHEHHDERDDDDVPKTDPMTLHFRRARVRWPFAEHAPVRSHGRPRRFLEFPGFVVELFVAVISEEKFAQNLMRN